MNAHHSHRWVAWLLPLLLLRAFVPAGFMLSWSEHGLQLVMCSGSGPMAMQMSASAHQTQQQHSESHPAGEPHEHSPAHDTSMCPFAAAGTSGALPSFGSAVAFVATVSHEAPALSGLDLHSPAVLIDRIRGPPLS